MARVSLLLVGCFFTSLDSTAVESTELYTAVCHTLYVNLVAIEVQLYSTPNIANKGTAPVCTHTAVLEVLTARVKWCFYHHMCVCTHTQLCTQGHGYNCT